MIPLVQATNLASLEARRHGDLTGDGWTPVFCRGNGDDNHQMTRSQTIRKPSQFTSLRVCNNPEWGGPLESILFLISTRGRPLCIVQLEPTIPRHVFVGTTKLGSFKELQWNGNQLLGGVFPPRNWDI